MLGSNSVENSCEISLSYSTRSYASTWLRFTHSLFDILNTLPELQLSTSPCPSRQYKYLVQSKGCRKKAFTCGGQISCMLPSLLVAAGEKSFNILAYFESYFTYLCLHVDFYISFSTFLQRYSLVLSYKWKP